jgi:hypothetical protein
MTDPVGALERVQGRIEESTEQTPRSRLLRSVFA